jgi:DNA-directed RNA polymerase
MDGSNNGAQHAAAYLMDRSTASLVNMTIRDADTAPADMYGTVGNGFLNKLLLKVAKDFLFIKNDVVTRSSCKRIVMCMNYGLTKGGALNYSKEEIETYTDIDNNSPFDAGFDSRLEVYEKFRDGVWDSVANIAPAILRTKEAMAEVGKVVCSLGDGIMRWETATGTKIAYTKHLQKSIRVARTIRGKRVYFTLKKTDRSKVEQSEVSNASAPNYTHSNDATHLRLVALGMNDDAPLMFIHDSFATIAKYAPEMARITRQTFIDMYKGVNPLRTFVVSNLEKIAEKLGICLEETLNVPCLEDIIKASEGDVKKFLKSLKKIKKNITRTNDLELDDITECIYFFR